MSALIDMTGQRFGRLVVTYRSGSTSRGQSRWLCRCDCGRDAVAISGDLRRGHTTSCGCYNRELVIESSTSHGSARRRKRSAEYVAWTNAKTRVMNPNDPDRWATYGGRGITMADEWLNDFAAFLSHIGPRPGPGYSLDRIDNDGNYEPGNVRWSTANEQRVNQRRPGQ